MARVNETRNPPFNQTYPKLSAPTHLGKDNALYGLLLLRPVLLDQANNTLVNSHFWFWHYWRDESSGLPTHLMVLVSLSGPHWITLEVGARNGKEQASFFNSNIVKFTFVSKCNKIVQNSQTVRNWKITPFSFTNCAWLKNYTFWLENFPENFITWVDGNYIWLPNSTYYGKGPNTEKLTNF